MCTLQFYFLPLLHMLFQILSFVSLSIVCALVFAVTIHFQRLYKFMYRITMPFFFVWINCSNNNFRSWTLGYYLVLQPTSKQYQSPSEFSHKANVTSYNAGCIEFTCEADPSAMITMIYPAIIVVYVDLLEYRLEFGAKLLGTV